MRKMRCSTRLALVPVIFLLPLVAAAQTTGDAPVTSGSDRLFLAFAEDATVVGGQWWEGQLEYADWDVVDAMILRGVAAFQPWERWELGARIGFGDTDASGPRSDGSGATDLDVWGKYHLGQTGDATEFALGGLATVPTGDDAAGLGYDSFAVEGFGSLRHRFPEWILSVQAGVRFNGDGQIFAGEGQVDLDGKTSPVVGLGAIYPVSDQVSLVAEARFEGERFDGGDSDVRALGGVNWRGFNRGMIRGAVSVGLADGAPDVQLLAGYAVSF